jgi:DNA polymerase elongation subunit (family B)
MSKFARTLNDRLILSGLPKPIKFNIYESNIDSFLRCIHIRNLQTCGWVEINKYKKCNDSTICEINIECDWKSISPKDDPNLGAAPFKICSFDIECTSSAEDGSFPQTNRIGDYIIQIGSVFSRYGGEIYKRHIITLGSCDPIEGVEVISVESEKDLLIEWTKLIKNENPDILTGYNIWDFDERYMY